MRFKQLAIVCMLAVLAAGCSSSPSDEPAAGGPRPNIPPEVAGHENEWPLANHDYSNTRTAVGSSINSSNVADLHVAWTSSLKGTSEWGAGTGNPIISSGVVYFEDLGANAYAVDLKTGNPIWETDYNNAIFGPSGPGIGYGKLYVVSRIDRYSALDLKTGHTDWEWLTGFRLATGAFQPYVFGNRVYVTTQGAVAGQGQVSFQSYQGGTSGAVFALNPDTGRPSWNWQAVTAGLWGHPEINSGAGIWFPPAIDTERQVTYWGTGNPSPIPGIKGWPNGSSRPGPDLWSDSLVALDHRSGKMLWYNQVKPHDLFNLDFQISPMLANVSINGAQKKIIIGSGKLGIVYAFDQDTGKILWHTPVGVHKNDDLQALPVDNSTTWVSPGAWGGVETPMAYNAGTVYVLADNVPSPYNATAFDANTPEQALNRSEGGSHLDTGTSDVIALDATDGKILWQHHLDQPAFAGITVVNDLLFTATFQGMVYALARSDGHVVWQWQAPGGTNAWPAVAGDTIVWPFGLGDSPSVIALSLHGQSTLPPPEPQRTPIMTPEGN